MESEITHVGKDYRKIMRKDKKYVMIVTEEDERYDGENGKQLSFYADNPFEGLLSDIAYGDNVDELRQSEDGHSNEGLFYVLYSTSDGKRIGSGTVDFDAIQEEIEEYEDEKVTATFCGIQLFKWKECDVNDTDELQFYDVEFCVDSMKKYNGSTVVRYMNGKMEIWNNDTGEIDWNGYVTDIYEVMLCLVARRSKLQNYEISVKKI